MNSNVKNLITMNDKEVVCIINSGCDLEIGKIYRPSFYGCYNKPNVVSTVALDDGYEYSVERFITLQDWIDLKLKTLQ